MNKPQNFYSGCQGKHVFHSRSEAQACCKRMGQSKKKGRAAGGLPDPYRCVYCGQFHIGRK